MVMSAPSKGTLQVSHPSAFVDTPRVTGLVASTGPLERDAAGPSEDLAATHRLETFRRALARSLDAVHLETAQELSMGEGG